MPSEPGRDDQFADWITSLEARHLADLRFAEVSRALKALSATYVEKRGRLGEGAALSGAGKRAAFALFYGPLHFITVREIATRLDAGTPRSAPRSGERDARTLVDLGCGTGAAGAALATSGADRPTVLGIDKSSWALDEAALTYRCFGLNARTRRGDAAQVEPPRGRADWLAAFTLNELSEDARARLLARLLDRAALGDRVLVVEPVARGVAPWWSGWADRVRQAGGRADEWRFRVPLPPIVQKLDRAAGMDHRELTARTLALWP